jgi:two-component system sensor kinase FixL
MMNALSNSSPAVRSDAYLRSILATVPDAMIVIDDAGSIQLFSAAAQRMFGYGEAEVIGQNVRMLMPGPDKQRHDSYMKRYLDTGVPHIIGIGRVTSARRRDGSVFPIELSIGDAQTPDGRVFTGFIRDLTERQTAERRLQDLQAELSHMSRINAMASLASILAHEINQPLTAITNYMEGARDLLGAGPPSADTIDMLKEALGEAAGQALRAGQIVRRLREFIARGDNEASIESLQRLVTDANALALIGAGELGVEVEVSIDPATDKVLVDRIQIQQVLLNLIRNAIEAMADRPMRKLDISAAPDAGGMVEVCVADSGPGITPSVAEHLFEPFRSSKAKGMGLGLSICRTIIEAHGGRIWADASAYGGTAFHFTLAAIAPNGDGTEMISPIGDGADSVAAGGFGDDD